MITYFSNKSPILTQMTQVDRTLHPDATGRNLTPGTYKDLVNLISILTINLLKG